MARIEDICAVITILVCTLMSTLPAAPVSAAGLDLKSMILMPGPLAQAHAREEKNCAACHSSFNKSAQDSLCLDCHENIAVDRNQATGFHGRSPLAGSAGCSSCHTDHEGRQYNIAPLDQDIFDHQHTDFPLTGRHASTACEGCHAADTALRETPAECYNCHQDEDQHRGALGRECGECHKPQSWNKPGAFDHNKTDFPLRGQHESLQCSSCHAGEVYSFNTNECVACHKLRDVHLGGYGQDCARCHTQEDWNKPSFDHAAQTDFQLTGAHRTSSCLACHFDDMKTRKPATDCVSCHRSSDVHAGRHGTECGACHNTQRWSESRFDHTSKTTWPLTGGHKNLSCLQCHRGSLDDRVSSECKTCHSTDDVHRSTQMADCSDCHQSTDWGSTANFDHELARFPLEGMHAVATCTSCHNSHEFQRASSECADCHQAEDAHKSALGQRCGSCHTPNGWALWTFDHDSATEFDLTGAHAGLSCGSCHQGKDAANVPGKCAGCHAADDRHEGNFGANCDQCHSTDSFGEVQWRK